MRRAILILFALFLSGTPGYVYQDYRYVVRGVV
jgi:hypothetical protein